MGTLLLFSPRWILALPMIPLIPLSLWRRPRLLTPVLLAGCIVLGPFMGLHWPIPQPNPAQGHLLRVLTCNVQSGEFDQIALTHLIRDEKIDIVALQEFPPSVKLDFLSGWNIRQEGTIAILSKFPLTALAPLMANHPPHQWPRHSLLPCFIQTPWGELGFATVHLPSPRYGLSHVLDRKYGLNVSKKGLLLSETDNRQNVSTAAINALAAIHAPLIVAGDFNMPSESVIFRRDWSDFTDAFSRQGKGYGWSFKDRAGPFPIDVRIDHILCSDGLTPLTCRVGPDVGSDHRPLIAEILLPEKYQ